MFGLIVKVPLENILRSGTSDLGSNFANPDEEIKKYHGTDNGNPAVLLTNSISYNEVVFLGETEYGKVEIAGVFLSDYSKKHTDEEEKLAYKLKYITKTPLIEIPKKEIKLEDKPIHFEFYEGRLDKLTFTKNNREYYCNLNEHFGGLLGGLYATKDYGAPFMRDENDVQTFFKEIENLPEEEKVKYSKLLEMLPKHYELCKQYFDRKIDENKLNEEILPVIQELNEMSARKSISPLDAVKNALKDGVSILDTTETDINNRQENDQKEGETKDGK